MKPEFALEPHEASSVGSGDRLAFTIFIAVVIHAFIILGLGFKAPKPTLGSQTMEITLASHRSDKAPEKADFLAQHNQEGSGTAEQAQQLSTDMPAEFAATRIQDVNPIPEIAASVINEPSTPNVVSTVGKSITKVSTQPDPEEEEQIEGMQAEQSNLNSEIASLQAKLDKQRQEYAKRPRIRTLTSESAKEAFDAKYLYEWGEKIERIGNLNYPQEALNQQLSGKLRLSVVINSDGSIHEITILQSSGKRVLDDAARQIVRLSAPFAALPPEISQKSKRLQIIRTLRFEMTGVSTSAN